MRLQLLSSGLFPLCKSHNFLANLFWLNFTFFSQSIFFLSFCRSISPSKHIIFSILGLYLLSAKVFPCKRFQGIRMIADTRWGTKVSVSCLLISLFFSRTFQFSVLLSQTRKELLFVLRIPEGKEQDKRHREILTYFQADFPRGFKKMYWHSFRFLAQSQTGGFGKLCKFAVFSRNLCPNMFELTHYGACKGSH